MSLDYEDGRDYGGEEEVFEDTGSLHSDSDISVLHDMEHELEVLVRRYRVPSNELESLLKVVMTMSEMMDHRREELEKVMEQKAELEEMWNKEKEKWKLLHTRKLELECRYDEERARHETERRRLESEKIQLETKTQQLNKLNRELQSDIQRLHVKVEQDEKTRTMLREQYKREYELKRNASVMRKGTLRRARPQNDRNSSLQPSQTQQPTGQRGGGLEDSMSYEVVSEKSSRAVQFSQNTNKKQWDLEESGTFQGLQMSPRYTRGFSLQKQMRQKGKKTAMPKTAQTEELILERSGSNDRPTIVASQEGAAQEERSSRPSSIVVLTRSNSEDTEHAITPTSPAPPLISTMGTSLQDELLGGAESMALLDPCVTLMDELNSNEIEPTQVVTKGVEEQEPIQPVTGGLDGQEPAQPVTGGLDEQEPAQPVTGGLDEQEPAQSVIGGLDGQEPAQPVTGGLDEQEPAQPVTGGLDEQEPAQPVTGGLDEQEPAQPVKPTQSVAGGLDEQLMTNGVKEQEPTKIETEGLKIQECIQPGSEGLDEQVPFQLMTEEVEEQEPIQPETERLKDKEPAQPVTGGLDEQEPAQPVTEGLDEQEPVQPVIGGLDEQEPAQSVTEGLDEHEPAQPVTEGLDEQEPVQPVIGGLDEQEPAQPVTGGLDEQEPAQSVTEGLDEQEPAQSVTERLDEQEPAQSVTEGLDEQEPTQSVTEGLDEQEPAQPVTEGLDEQEPAQPVTGGLDEQEPAQSVTEGLDEQEPAQSVTEGLDEQEPAQPLTEGLDEQEPAQPLTGGLDEQESAQPVTEWLDEQEPAQPQAELAQQLGRDNGNLAQTVMGERPESVSPSQALEEDQTYLESQSMGSDLDELVAPDMIAMERAEAEMLRQEKEAWKEETARLLLDYKAMRGEKEALESQVAQLLLETAHLKEAEVALRKDLQDARNERDEVLANYFDQTYSDHCITKKELFDVLKKLETTKMELEIAREEKAVPQVKKKSIFRRVGDRMKKLGTRRRRDGPMATTPKPPTNMQGGQEMLTIRRPIQMSSLAEAEVEQAAANLTANNDWRIAQGSSVRLDQIPTWVEQIHLKGIETVHVDKTVIGKTYHSTSVHARPTRSRATFSKALGTVGTTGSQWCVEVWVATRENASACIEIVDVLKKANTNRIRQRFVVQQAKNIQCMKYIPGSVVQEDVPTVEEPHPTPEVEATSSGDHTHQARTRARRHDSTMWVVTDDNRLCIYPTTDPSHLLINTVHLCYKTFCIEYVAGKVLVGHTDSIITVYTRSNASPMWNIYSPSKQVTLVQLDPAEEHNVKCMTEVGSRLWVICGKWIYLLDREELISEGSIFLEESNGTPDSIVSVGSYAAVLVNSSSVNLYDAVSAALLKKLTVSSLFSTLTEPIGTSSSVYITAITADYQNIYIGTSNGKIIAVFIRGLMSSNARRNEAGNALLSQTCVSIHSHREKIDSLMYIPLSLQQDASADSSSLMYTSLVVSAGKGYHRYTDVSVQLEGEALQEVDDQFQVMVWGHPIERR